MKKIIILLALISFVTVLPTQSSIISDAVKKGIRYNLTEDGKNFVTFGFQTQIFVRYNELNDGIKDAKGTAMNSDFDIALNRNYFPIYADIENFNFFSMFCMTGQPVSSSVGPAAPSKPTFYFYDVWGSYKVIPKAFNLGMGLNMYSGGSRYYSCYSSQTLGADVPNITAPMTISNDNAARHLSIFANGQIGMFDYRIAYIKPFLADGRPYEIVPGVAYDIPTYDMAYSGRFELQFWDKEVPEVCFKTHSWLGAKKVLNFGVGGNYYPQSTVSYTCNNHSYYHDKLHLAADVYFDMPLANESALMCYAGYLYSKFGPNYMQSFGTMDIWGSGIKEPQYGTGDAVLFQIGYVIPKTIINVESKIQPFYTMTYKNFEALNDKIFVHSAGINWYWFGQKVKFTVEYIRRPYITGNTMADYKLDSYKNTVLGRFQFGL
jgi:hypothetical protein